MQKVRAPQLLSLPSRDHEMQLLSLCPRACASKRSHRNKEAHALQLAQHPLSHSKEDCVQLGRPRTIKNRVVSNLKNYSEKRLNELNTGLNKVKKYSGTKNLIKNVCLYQLMKIQRKQIMMLVKPASISTQSSVRIL